MNKKQSAYVSMHGKSSNQIDENLIKFESNPKTSEEKIKLSQGMANEKHLAQKQDEHKHSSNKPKTEALNAAALNIYETGSKIGSFAFDSHNVELQSKVSISLSDLKKLPDNLFISRCATILGCGQQYLPELTDYLVTAPTLAEGNDLLGVLADEITKQGKRKSDLTSATSQLNKAIKIVNKNFKFFDNIVETQRTSDPDWYNIWWGSRSLPQTSKSRISAKLKVYNAETYQPLPGAKISYVKVEADGNKLTPTPDMVKTIKVKSAGGGVNLKSLTTGGYLFTVSYAGCDTKQMMLYINEGILTRLNFPLNNIAS